MMSQWSYYDDLVVEKLDLLRTMCQREAVSDFESEVSESSTTQCGLNSIAVTLKPFVAVPAGTIITIVGLNGGEPNGVIQLDAMSSSFLGNAQWEAFTCSQWCSKSGMCPQSGSAEDDSCHARTTSATGQITGKRCVRWCDTDAKLTVTVLRNIPAATKTIISVTMLNPTFSQMPIPLKVSASSGSGLYIEPREILTVSGSGGVLAASMAPVITDVQVTEDPCGGVFDTNTNKWRGSCAGMINTIIFSMKFSLELHAGTRIIISGLVRSGSSWPPPNFRDLPGMLKELSVEKWESSTGTLTLMVLEMGPARNSSVVPVGQTAKFALEFEMPFLTNGDEGQVNTCEHNAVKPDITIDVNHAGPQRNCDFVPFFLSNTALLKPKSPADNSFERRIVGSSTCFPGECNSISVTFSPNRALSEVDDVVIVLTGLFGMTKSPVCNPSTTCGNSDGNLIPLLDVDTGLMLAYKFKYVQKCFIFPYCHLTRKAANDSD